MNKEVSDALYMLLHCALKDKEFETQKEQFDIVYKYIEELHNKIDKAIEITHRILMNNADNRMICSKEEEEYFDWLDKEMLEQEKILKDSDVDE